MNVKTDIGLGEEKKGLSSYRFFLLTEIHPAPVFNCFLLYMDKYTHIHIFPPLKIACG